MHDAIVVIVAFHVGHKHVVHEVERIDGLQQFVLFVAAQLTDVCLGGVEQDTVHEGGRPQHLHFDDEYASAFVTTAHIYDAVIFEWRLGHEMNRQIFYFCNVFVLR